MINVLIINMDVALMNNFSFKLKNQMIQEFSVQIQIVKIAQEEFLQLVMNLNGAVVMMILQLKNMNMINVAEYLHLAVVKMEKHLWANQVVIIAAK